MKNLSAQCRCILAVIFLAVHSAAGQTTVPSGYVTAFVDKKAAEIRERLQSKYESEDKALLLIKKESVDSQLLPAMLLQELGDPDELDWCRIFRWDFENTNVHGSTDATGEDLTKLRAALYPFRLRDHRLARFTVVTRRYPYVGADYPLVLWMEGRVGKDTGALCVNWYEPYLANRDLDFPIHPERCVTSWDRAAMRLYENGFAEPRAVETDDGKDPTFCNPPQFYTIFDALRLRHVLQRRPIMPGVPATGNGPHDGSCNVTLTGEDRALVRNTNVRITNGKLSEIVIHQEPLQLLHYAMEAYVIRRDVDKQHLGEEPFRPSSRQQYLEGGREIDIQFAHESGSSPIRIVITSGGNRLYEAEFKSLTYDDQDLLQGFWKDHEKDALREVDERIKDVYFVIDNHVSDWTPHPYSAAELNDSLSGGLLRARIKCNIFTALKTRDFVMLENAITAYHRLLSRERVDQDMYVFSLESLAQAGFDHIDDEMGLTLVGTYLEDAYRGTPGRQLCKHIVRLTDQYRYGFAMAALTVLKSKFQTDHSLIRWANDMEKMLRKQVAEDASLPFDPQFPYLPKIRHANAVLAANFLSEEDQHEHEVP